VHSVLAIVYAVPLVITLQRGLRHAQQASETRIDGKTGLLNDKTWRREAASEVARAVRTRTPVAIGILDIDHFKAVNDTYGHLAGDAVLSAVAAATTALLRDYDVVGRVGGEEFAFILPNIPGAEVAQVAERLREKIPRLAFPHADPASPVPARVTVSIGVAAADRPDWDLDRFYRLADQALYVANLGLLSRAAGQGLRPRSLAGGMAILSLIVTNRLRVWFGWCREFRPGLKRLPAPWRVLRAR
jgi:diguanylate cyclase (GGDEF)-like protein